MKPILIIEDEKDIVDLIAYQLTQSGFSVISALDGPSGLERAKKERPSLIILDLMLPGMDGKDVCRALKSTPLTQSIPILMLTAKTEEMDRVVGFELGADDYVTKPFSPRELVSRVRAVLRRTELTSDSTHGLIEVDERLKIDFDRHEVWVAGKLVNLRPTEYRLLYYLVQNTGWVVSHDQILTNVWGYEYRDQPHYVRLYINYLRQKIEKDPANPVYILTERGLGYRFVDFRRDNPSESSENISEKQKNDKSE